MMEAILNQRHLFDKRTFSILERGIEIKKQSLFNSAQVFVKFESIGCRTTTFTLRNNILLLISICMFFAGIFVIAENVLKGEEFGSAGDWRVLIVMSIFSGIHLLAYVLSHKTLTYLVDKDNSRIEFFGNPDKNESLKNFLRLLHDRRNQYLLGHYGEINKNFSYESEYQKILWLSSKDVIDFITYETKVKELDQVFSKPNFVRGFGMS